MFSNVSLDAVKTYLGYQAGDTTRDSMLQLYLDSGIEVLQELLNRRLQYGLYKDTYQYKSARHYLRETPVVAIDEILIGTTPVADTEYLLFKDQGYIHFKNFNGGPPYYQDWLCDGQYMTVTYVGGYLALPNKYLMALFNSVQAADNVNKQSFTYGGPVKRVSIYDVGVTDFAIPSSGNVTTTIKSSLTNELAAEIEAVGQLGTWLLHESEYITNPGSPTL